MRTTTFILALMAMFTLSASKVNLIKNGDFAEGGYDAPCVRAVIEMVWRTHASLAILPFQDMCGFGKDTRMNIPGVPEANWRYRATQEVIDGVDLNYFQKINRLFGRA